MALAFGCKAQTPVFPLFNNPNSKIENAYYKDIDNYRDQFVGTWLYTNGSTSLKIILKKINMCPSTGFGSVSIYYEDYLVGEYEYIENGVLKVSTLANLAQNSPYPSKYNLSSITTIDNKFYPQCLTCPACTSRYVLDFSEPTRDPIKGPEAQFIIRTIVENGIQKIKATFIKSGAALNEPIPALRKFSVPYGEYTLTKQ